MLHELAYIIRVIWASMKKDIRSALTDRAFTLMGILTPVNAFVLMSLFMLGGSNAPTAVVMTDTGPYAQKFYQSMSTLSSFRLQKMTAVEATNLLQAGHVVAIITIPPEFDQRIQQKQSAQIQLRINNLNTDFTGDIRRAIQTTIVSFYAHAFPGEVTIIQREQDTYPHDTDYMQYLTVSVVVAGMLMGGVIQAGTAMAVEWEKGTMKEILLSPASSGGIITGKMFSSLLINLVSISIIQAVLILVLGVWPVHWDEVIGFSILGTVIFVGLGILLGTILKQRKEVVVITMGITLPLFFISAPFGPLSFNTGAIQILAQIFPIYYTIAVLQHAFHDFTLNTYGVNNTVLILYGYAGLVLLLSILTLRRTTIAH